MPTLHSLTIRRRGTTRTDDSTNSPPAKVANAAHTVYTLKGLFHRKASSNRKTSSDTDRSDTKPEGPNPNTTPKTKTEISTMGNAPSDMNQQGPGSPKANSGAGTIASTPKRPYPPLARPPTAASESSIRSRAMPGAEPPTPVPAEPVVTKEHPPNTPHMEKVQVQGYDIKDGDAAPESKGPGEGDREGEAKEEDRDLEAGLLPSVGTFEVDAAEPIVEDPARAEAPAAEEEPSAAAVDAADTAQTRTPRPQLKTEELLAPLDFVPSRSPPGHGHNPSASDATAVSISPSAAKAPTTPPIWTPGTYVLLNARAETAMDLHGHDYTSIIGYPMHGGPNQQWEFIPSGYGYAIRCVRAARAGHALYLTVGGAGGVREGAPIVASAFPVTWDVEQTEEGIR